MQGTLHFYLNLLIDDASSTVLGTVAAIVAFVAIIAISLLGVLITIILFVIVKNKLKTLHSNEVQFTNQITSQRYNS